jgi:peptide/nickel transport system permease protein
VRFGTDGWVFGPDPKAFFNLWKGKNITEVDNINTSFYNNPTVTALIEEAAMPLVVLSVGYYARLIHTSMVEVLESPYVRAARARGVSETSVLFRHGFRNGCLPVVTVLGVDMAALLGGVIFTENVFALPGIGSLAVQSVFNLDIVMIMGTVLFGATLVVSANLAVDVLYRWLDPRIRTSQ